MLIISILNFNVKITLINYMVGFYVNNIKLIGERSEPI